VALNRIGESTRGHRRVIRLGVASLRAQLRARPYEIPPAPTAQAAARQATSLTRAGRLFLVAAGSARFGTLWGAPVTAEAAGLQPAFGSGPPLALMTGALAPLHPFLRALPSRFRHVQTRKFAGFMPLSVYVFREAGAAVESAHHHDRDP